MCTSLSDDDVWIAELAVKKCLQISTTDDLRCLFEHHLMANKYNE